MNICILDLLLANWVCSKPAALNFTVVSLLGSNRISCHSADVRKHENNDQKCSELSLAGYVSQWVWEFMEHGVRIARLNILFTFGHQACCEDIMLKSQAQSSVYTKMNIDSGSDQIQAPC